MDDLPRIRRPEGGRPSPWRRILGVAAGVCIAAGVPACGDSGSEEAPAPGSVSAPTVAPADESPTTLARLPVDFETAASLTGTGTVEARVADGRLIVEGRFEGLESSVAGAELRRAVPGLRGPVVAPLEVSAEGDGTAGSMTGSPELDSALREALEAGELYVQIYSEQNPEGVLRGWLPPVR